jgi:hypothetical protein
MHHSPPAETVKVIGPVEAEGGEARQHAFLVIPP